MPGGRTCLASCRISIAQLATQLGLTWKITRTRGGRAPADGVVIDDAAELRGMQRTLAHVLRPGDNFDLSKSTTSVAQAFPSRQTVDAQMAARREEPPARAK